MDTPQQNDTTVRFHIYDAALATGRPPVIEELARRTGLGEAAVKVSLGRMAAEHILVLQPESGEILMAAPFSAVPTAFVVETPRMRAYANCIWDAIGIPVMAHLPARIETACGCCGEQMELHVTSGGVTPSDGVVHFALPAMRWWENIVFT